MKQTIILVVAMMATASANETSPIQEELSCEAKCYEAINQLLETKTITLEEAQKLWIKTGH